MASIAGLPGTNGTQTVTGTVTVANTSGNPVPVTVVNFPATQSVSVTNFPTTYTVLQGTSPWVVSGTVAVSNFPATQPVSGTVAVSNFPATQTVTGTVNIGNFPATTTVTGTVTVSNLPTLQTTPTTSLSAQSTIQNGTVQDDGAMKVHHTMVVITSAGVAAGTVVLQLSQDNTNWFNALTISTTSATTVYSADVTGVFRYSRAAITVAITGGTITATIAAG